jgi:CBS domain-containing protein
MSLEDVVVSDIMVKEVLVVNEIASLQQACKVMSTNKIGSVIVVSNADIVPSKDRIPIGIITESDVVKQIGIDPYRSHYSVSELLHRPLVTVPPSTSLRYALRLMVGENIRRLPVVENGKLVGIVSDKDIYRAIVKNESLITSLINDELLIKHIEELEQPWVYKLGEILHKRLNTNRIRESEKSKKMV